ncbi:uncharacterized protein LOC123307216 isoform X2 [Coccinella septempunctata]|nr:uncharacterized protein LOC123307216 isoform X2 [Coccinella septempunctata]
MANLQQQQAHGLSALGTLLQNMLPNLEQSENVKILADACQLFSNVHHDISAHRKYKIIPHLSYDCKKVARSMEMDEFLFNKTFAEAVKTEQSLKKASAVFKNKKSWQQPYSQPGPSGSQTPKNYLNEQRPIYKGRKKERGEKKEKNSLDHRPRYRNTAKKFYKRY